MAVVLQNELNQTQEVLAQTQAELASTQATLAETKNTLQETETELLGVRTGVSTFCLARGGKVASLHETIVRCVVVVHDHRPPFFVDAHHHCVHSRSAASEGKASVSGLCAQIAELHNVMETAGQERTQWQSAALARVAEIEGALSSLHASHSASLR